MKAISSAAIVLACALLAEPALAGQRRRGGDDSGQGSGRDSGGQAVGRAVPRGEAPRTQPPAAAAPPARRQAPPAERPRAESPRADAPRVQAPRAQPRAIPRAEPQRSDRPADPIFSGSGSRAGGGDRTPNNGGVIGRAVPRTEPYREFESRPRGNRPIIVAPRYYNYRSGRYFSAPYRGYRPYFFRPRTRLHYYSIYLGYPVHYSYVYSRPVYVYGYGSPAYPVTIGPGAYYYGGVSLEIWPSHAEVFVDGSYAGLVEDFDGTRQPLTLMPGTHRIEIYAPGYEPLIFDVVVRPGEVVPYRGSLVPQGSYGYGY
jgi:hypothetical protein